MNAWRKQSRDCCFAYALWYIGAVDDEALHEYESHVHKFGLSASYLDQWRANYAPWASRRSNPFDSLPASWVSDVKLGVAIVRWGFGAAHAVAIIDGMILDPEGKGHLESVEDFLINNRNPAITSISEKP